MPSTLQSRHSLCANDEAEGSQSSHCEAVATKFCGRCSLVQYCSQGCQSKHWPRHKIDCNSPIAKDSWKPKYHNERREPNFVETSTYEQKSFWSDMPAIDLLRLKDNEGVTTQKDLDVLLAVSADLESVVKTVVDLSDNYQSRCRITLNHSDEAVTIRNALLILVAFAFEPDVATAIMIHLWYSALISSEMLDLLQARISPLMQEICDRAQPEPDTCKEQAVWRFTKSSVSITLKRQGWNNFLAFFTPPEGMSMEQALNIRRKTTMDPLVEDAIDKQLYNLDAHDRVAQLKFRDDGMLLPFGASRQGFDVPNPTLFRDHNSWPMHESVSPLSCWNISDIPRKTTVAQCDRYGALYHYLDDLFCQFCKKVRTCHVEFEIYNEPIHSLPEVLKGHCLFDRIQISQLVEHSKVGTKDMIEAFASCLRHPSENPHATLIGLRASSVVFMKRGDGKAYNNPSPIVSQQYRQYLRNPSLNLDIFASDHMYDADFWRFITVRDFFGDDEESYVKCKSQEVETVDVNADSTISEEKEVNTVTQKWPMKLKEGMSNKDFGLLSGMNAHGCERYIEWKRKGSNHQAYAVVTAALKILTAVKRNAELK